MNTILKAIALPQSAIVEHLTGAAFFHFRLSDDYRMRAARRKNLKARLAAFINSIDWRKEYPIIATFLDLDTAHRADDTLMVQLGMTQDSFSTYLPGKPYNDHRDMFNPIIFTYGQTWALLALKAALLPSEYASLKDSRYQRAIINLKALRLTGERNILVEAQEIYLNVTMSNGPRNELGIYDSCGLIGIDLGEQLMVRVQEIVNSRKKL